LETIHDPRVQLLGLSATEIYLIWPGNQRIGTEPSGFELELALPWPVIRSSKVRWAMWVGTKGIVVVGDQRRSKMPSGHETALFLPFCS